MLEIYNETIRDLLAGPPASPGSPPHSPVVLSGGGAVQSDVGSAGIFPRRTNQAVKQYTIQHDAAGNTAVQDLTVRQYASRPRARPFSLCWAASGVHVGGCGGADVAGGAGPVVRINGHERGLLPLTLRLHPAPP
eukprot:8274767-Pyramimonas_sp.AAC.1